MDVLTNFNADEKKKMVTLTILTVFCIFLELFMHFYLGVSIGYTHFFYVLLVLAGIWYQRKAVILALCLAATHISVGYFVFSESLWAPLLRSAMFVIVTLLVGTLSEELKRSEATVKENNERYISYIKEAAMRLKTPVEVVEQNIATLLEDIKTGDTEGEQVLLQLQIQVKNMEQIRQNIIDLNKTIVDGYGKMSQASKQFLIE
jgi:hypothetical protein